MKFVRKAHRWMAPAFVLAVIAVMLTNPITPQGAAQAVQMLLMLLLMISGVALFVYPFIVKSRKQ